MKIIVMLSTLIFIMSCSTSSGRWDSGAQRQQAIQEEAHSDRVENVRDQFPDATQILNQPQPF